MISFVTFLFSFNKTILGLLSWFHLMIMCVKVHSHLWTSFIPFSSRMLWNETRGLTDCSMLLFTVLKLPSAVLKHTHKESFIKNGRKFKRVRSVMWPGGCLDRWFTAMTNWWLCIWLQRIKLSCSDCLWNQILPFQLAHSCCLILDTWVLSDHKLYARFMTAVLWH